MISQYSLSILLNIKNFYFLLYMFENLFHAYLYSIGKISSDLIILCVSLIPVHLLSTITLNLFLEKNTEMAYII